MNEMEINVDEEMRLTFEMEIDIDEEMRGRAIEL